MTRITVHALGPERVVVCGDDGRRWILTVPAEAIGSEAARAALDEIRGSGPDVETTVGATDVDVGSIAALRRFAEACDRRRAVLWRYGGRAYRTELNRGNAPATARLIERLLRAGVHDPSVAAALTEPPLVADPLRRRSSGEGRRTGRDVLERWEDDRWVPHVLTPAPGVDPVTGVLRRIVARPSAPWHPPGFRHLHAELPHLASVDPRFQPDALAPAGGFSGDEDEPEHAALLSGIAHYCGAYLGQGRRRCASADELRASGERVLTVAQWRPHDPALHELPGFPFVRDDDRAATWWLAGDERGETCWVPLSLVHAGYLASGLQPLPPTNGHNLVGLDAGADLADAQERAAAHVIAHDAVARWWRRAGPLPACDLPAVLGAAGGEQAPEIRVLAVPSRTGIPVRLAVVDDRERNVVGLGFAAAADPDGAASKAVSEALIQYASARDLDSPESLIRNAESIGNGGVAGLAPFDPSRRYDRTAFADPRRLIDPMCHVQYGLSPSSVARVRRRATPHGAASQVGVGVSAMSALRAADTRVVVVDVTTPRVRDAGFAACRVLATGFERLTPAAFPATLPRTPPYPGW